MNESKPEEQTSSDDERDLQNWIARWKEAEERNDYARIGLYFDTFANLAGKYHPAKNFARKQRDDILHTIKSERFLRSLKGELDLKQLLESRDNSIQRAIRPGALIKIFADLNWVIEEPHATMAYYEEVSTTPEVAHNLDRLLWDYWLRTERWDKLLSYAVRCGWFSDPLPDGEREEFMRRSDALFLALLRSNDVPHMFELLERLDNLTDGRDKTFVLKSIRQFYRQDAPSVVQQRIDKLNSTQR